MAVVTANRHLFGWKIAVTFMCITLGGAPGVATTVIVDLKMRSAQSYLHHRRLLYYPLQYRLYHIG